MTTQLQSWGIEPGFVDARGNWQDVDPAAAEGLAKALAGSIATSRRHVAVLRRRDPPAVRVRDSAGVFRWTLSDVERMIASGEARGDTIELPPDLPVGSYSLDLETNDGASRRGLVLIAPDTAYEPQLFRDGGRAWLLTVQLYAVRSARNWGHGDFTDLGRLLEIASEAGAAGIGVNPLHALAPGQSSAYSPSSRLFLNPLYIDIEATDEFPGIDACGLGVDLARLRSLDLIDYAAVDALKRAALRAAYDAFKERATSERRQSFAAFRQMMGTSLRRFAVFESLRERFGLPWRNWPQRWRDPGQACGPSESEELRDAGLHEFMQWIADQQLRACTAKAQRLGLRIGLYLDVAVGVDANSADTWAAPDALCQELTIGAPPDIYNPRGQNWGLAPLHPQTLIDTDFSLFRQVMRSAMRYAGAIRIDHALGLNRIYLIPSGASAAGGVYIRLPLTALLAVIAQESDAARCLVIGEDLGTVPEGLRETLNEWGVWSYRVGLFERGYNGAFRRPDEFSEKAIVTFSTHDLPTFAGWKTLHDFMVRRTLGLDAGESEGERHDALNAMRAMLAEQGLAPDLALVDVMRYLARTSSRLLAVSIDDILELCDQPNIPGTVTEYPNWRRRLPLDLNDLGNHVTFRAIADALAAEGRSCVKTSG